MMMIPTTLCYMEKDDAYLMLHRIKKEKDVNKDKWIGVGGKFEEDESPEECLLREVKEETGVTLTSWQLRGIVTFVSVGWESELMFLYTADGWEGELPLPAADIQREEQTIPDDAGGAGLAEGFPADCEKTPGTNAAQVECDEGVLEWVAKDQLHKLNLWEGDKIFLKLLQEDVPFFSLKLSYEGNDLRYAALDGKRIR